MYVNSGYLYNTRVPIKDKSKPLLVGSCGTYRLRTKQKLPTWHPRGRLDYQLLYVASGKTHFFFNGQEEIVPAGYMVLYQPRQEQHYEYYGEEQPEVYWVHFTGKDVKAILKHFDIPTDKNVFFSGVPSAYQHLFKEMIRELQTCRTGYQELLEMYLRQIFLLIQRTRQESITESTPSMYRKKPEQQLPRWVMTRESMDVQRWFLNKKSNGKGCRHGSLFFFLSVSAADFSADPAHTPREQPYHQHLPTKGNGVRPTVFPRTL